MSEPQLNNQLVQKPLSITDIISFTRTSGKVVRISGFNFPQLRDSTLPKDTYQYIRLYESERFPLENLIQLNIRDIPYEHLIKFQSTQKFHSNVVSASAVDAKEASQNGIGIGTIKSYVEHLLQGQDGKPNFQEGEDSINTDPNISIVLALKLILDGSSSSFTDFLEYCKENSLSLEIDHLREGFLSLTYSVVQRLLIKNKIIEPEDLEAFYYQVMIWLTEIGIIQSIKNDPKSGPFEIYLPYGAVPDDKELIPTIETVKPILFSILYYCALIKDSVPPGRSLNIYSLISLAYKVTGSGQGNERIEGSVEKIIIYNIARQLNLLHLWTLPNNQVLISRLEESDPNYKAMIDNLLQECNEYILQIRRVLSDLLKLADNPAGKTTTSEEVPNIISANEVIESIRSFGGRAPGRLTFDAKASWINGEQ